MAERWVLRGVFSLTASQSEFAAMHSVMSGTDFSAAATLIAAGSALVLLVATLEGVILNAVLKRPYDWRAYGASLGDALGRGLLRFLPLGAIQLLFAFLWEHRIYTMPAHALWPWLLLLIGQDFFYYWMHRADHRVRWLWATHAVHHSPNEMNLAVAYRLGWTQRLSGGALFFAPLVLIGFHPLLVVGALSANLLYQFWLHAAWIPKLGPLEYVLNTPSHHRVHHASNPQYLDANFGGVLIVFDRLFGTFVAERSDVPCRYGLTEPLHTYNPVKVALHEWVALARDLRKARGVRELVSYAFRPPGWRPGLLRAIDDEPSQLGKPLAPLPERRDGGDGAVA